MITSLYIHIPFCKKKCNYCDFVSYAGKEELIDEYIRTLIREFDFLRSTFNFLLSTIYFGGGTPTLLKPHHFETILKNVGATFMVVRNRQTGTSPVPTLEITVEANPGTADKAKLKVLRSLGVNRLSIGAQSFNHRHLRTLGRIHTAEETLKSYDDARAAGFENINLDLIFALPDQTLDEWKNDLQTAINLMPNHLSTYNLQIEEGTPLWEMIWKPATKRRGFQNIDCEETAKFIRRFPSTLQLPAEEEELAMYEFAIETLTDAGYRHYEISNFAKPGFECLHNINYWKNGNYIGLGAGAHSHINGRRWSNPNCIESYIETESRNRYITATETDQRETIFMGLRLLEGLPTEKFIGFEKEVAELIEDGLLIRENNHYRLTRRGLYLGNLVFEKFV